jgi:hypothetical protein
MDDHPVALQPAAGPFRPVAAGYGVYSRYSRTSGLFQREATVSKNTLESFYEAVLLSIPLLLCNEAANA